MSSKEGDKVSGFEKIYNDFQAFSVPKILKMTLDFFDFLCNESSEE